MDNYGRITLKKALFNTINLIHGKYDGIFNLTITPLRNSDVFAPYGYYEKKRMKSASWIKNINPNVIFNRFVSSSSEEKEKHELLNMKKIFEEKEFLLAWVVSNCGQTRDDYVRALQEYIPIHVYGLCGIKYKQSRTCERNSYKCEIKLHRYKFVLAFENSFCDDYVTEKYWQAIFRGNVPIVLGGSSYDKKLVIGIYRI